MLEKAVDIFLQMDPRVREDDKQKRDEFGRCPLRQE